MKKIFTIKDGESSLWCPDYYIFSKTLTLQGLGGCLGLFSFIEFETGSYTFFLLHLLFSSLTCYYYCYYYNQQPSPFLSSQFSLLNQ